MKKLIFLFFSLHFAEAQKLTIADALSMALEKNYALSITKVRIKAAVADNTKGNAGLLPTVTGSITRNGSSNNINQVFFPIGTTVRDPLTQTGVLNTNGNIGVNAVWTLYDGQGMYLMRDRLKENVKLNQEANRGAVINTIAQVSVAFYDIVRQEQRIKTFVKALEISGERQRLSKDRYEVGQGSKLDYQSAFVDFNEDKAALVAQEQVVQNAKIILNTLLVRSPDEAFAVEDTILPNPTLKLEELSEKLNAQNPLLAQALLNKKMSLLDTKLRKSEQMPQLDMLGGYNYSNVQNGAGFGVKKGSTGQVSLGLRATINIFDGQNQKRRIQQASIQEELADLNEKDLRLQLNALLQRTFLSYKNSLTLVNLEVENYAVARQNVDIAFERYKIGVSPALELREAQRNAVAAETRLIEAKYNAKLAEIELLRLSGGSF